MGGEGGPAVTISHNALDIPRPLPGPVPGPQLILLLCRHLPDIRYKRVTSSGYHWGPVQTYSLDPPSPLTSGGRSTKSWQVGGMHPTAMLSCYRPQRSCGQGYIFCTCLSLCHGGGGGSASVHAGIPPLREQTPPPGSRPPGSRLPPGADPPGADTPLEQTPPSQDQTPLGSRLQHMVYEWPVCILLECILLC